MLFDCSKKQTAQVEPKQKPLHSNLSGGNNYMHFKTFLYITSFLLATLSHAETIFSGVDLENRPKIAFLTVVIGEQYSEAVRFGTKSKQTYCQQHGYDLIIATEHITSAYGHETTYPRHPAWTKISLAAKYLPQYDYIFFCDADTIIMNPSISLESLLNENYDLSICARDFDRPDPFMTMNSGVWFLKNSENSCNFLRNVWLEGDNEHNSIQANWEQDAILQLLRRSYSLQGKFPLDILFLESRYMNAKPQQYQKGDFLVHFCQIHGGELTSIFRDFEAIYQNHNQP